jgi:hypothetical protein
MNIPQFYIFLSYPQLYRFYAIAIGSAISLFLVFYIRNLILQGKKGGFVKSAPLSMCMNLWLNVMYPKWLDKFTFRQIFKAFVGGLGIAIGSWMILAILFLIVIMKVYAP